MKKLFLALLLAVLYVGPISMVLAPNASPSPVSAIQSDKLDDECTGHETVGRCADKCPTGTYLQGYDKDTGAAVCNANPTGCPYGDHVPLGPECDKLAPAQQAPQAPEVVAPIEVAPTEMEFAGK